MDGRADDLGPDTASEVVPVKKLLPSLVELPACGLVSDIDTGVLEKRLLGDNEEPCINPSSVAEDLFFNFSGALTNADPSGGDGCVVFTIMKGQSTP